MIKFCFLQEYPSLKEGLFDLTNISKAGLKKLNLSKKYLNKPIRVKDEVEVSINIVNFQKINPIYIGATPEMIFEDENFIVFSKPNKIHSHPLSYDECDNLLSYLLSQRQELLNVNGEKYDRGLLYRLDYETSGLLYYAKSEEHYKELRKNFNSIVKKKNYYAVVTGELISQNITHYLCTSDKRGSIVKEDQIKGTKCTVEVELIDYNSKLNQSLVSVNLNQGFKHQIRAQLSLIGFPIVGDPLYSKVTSSRMWLHCYQYCFDFNLKNYNIEDSSSELKSFFTNFNC